MSRSIKKGPYIDEKLMKKISEMNKNDEKKVLKTWARASMIIPEFVGHTLAIHNGRKFIPVFITENMVGHRLGEFALTRIFKGHSSKEKRLAAAAAAAGTAPGAAPGAPGAPAPGGAGQASSAPQTPQAGGKA